MTRMRARPGSTTNGEPWDIVPISAADGGLNAIYDLNIGTHRTPDGTRNWDGYIDDLAVFDYALTAEMVGQLYRAERTPLDLLGFERAPAPNAATSWSFYQ